MTATLALFVLASCAPAPQSGDLIEVLTRKDQVLLYQGAPTRLVRVYDPVSGLGGGWVAPARSVDVSTGASGMSIIGQRPAQLDGPVEVLRTAQTIGGFQQGDLFSPSMANGQVAYVASDRTVSANTVSAWIDDQLIVQAGDTLPGLAATWTQVSQIRLASNGTAVILGSAFDPATQAGHSVVMRWPSMQMLVAPNASIPGSPLPLRSLSPSSLVTSPDGAHWAAIASFRDTPTGANRLNGAVVDGAIHDFGAGFLAIEGAAVPPGIAAIPGVTEWDRFLDVSVSDRGDVVLFADGYYAASQGSWALVVRNGVPLLGPGALATRLLVGVDERGMLLTRRADNGVLYAEGQPIFSASTEVDLNRNGIANAGWSLSRGPQRYAAPGPQSLSVSFAQIASPTGVPVDAIVRARNYRLGRPTCSGVPNSTGSAAEMIVTGDQRAGENEIAFQAFGMPTQSVGFFLMSRTPGFVQQPGGSQGNLCLGGSIGRLSQQIFSTGTTGIGGAEIDLTVVPQPTGTVAASAGQTWLAQAWFRDTTGSAATSNFTGAVAVTFD